MLDAMADMVAQDLLLKPPQRRAHRRNLRDDVDAVAVLFHHARQAAHLAFDPVQSLDARRLDLFSHAVIYPYGIGFKSRKGSSDGRT